MQSSTYQFPITPGQRALLLVEDHDDFRQLVKKAFECFLPGWQIREADSVASAVEQLRLSPFDVMICDMTLPDGVATDVVDALPSLTRQTTRVVVFSNHHESQIALLRARPDIHGFTSKERGLKELALLVERVASAPDFNPPPLTHV